MRGRAIKVDGVDQVKKPWRGPAALTALKYFCEDVPELHVIAAGSLLGVRQHEGTGFPVGKVNTQMLYPMSYTEFLRAVGKDVLAEMLEAGDWLLRARLIYHCHRITKPALPVDSYRDGAFKVFFSDVGLLGAKAGVDASVLIQGNRIFQEFKGALAEQYVQQQLRAEYDIAPSYRLSESSRTEPDFLFQSAMAIVSVEVKA